MSDVIMPRLSDTMEEGTLARWLKAPGDAVHRGDVLAEIETDKATMELEAYDDGVLEQVLLEAGGTAPIGQVIAILGSGSGTTPGVAPPARSDRPAEPDPGTGPHADPGAEPHPSVADGGDQPDGGGDQPGDQTDGGGDQPRRPTRPDPTPTRGVVTSPLVRSLAARHGIPLDAMTGSGPAGRILRRDVEARIAENDTGGNATRADRATGDTAGSSGVPESTHLASRRAPETSPAAAADVEEIPLTRLRRVTAERLTASTQVPHFDLVAVIDAGPLLALREDINGDAPAGGVRVSVNDLLVKACARVLATHPEVNVAFGGDRILRYHRVNVGIAVAVDDGLTVPVIHDADCKTLAQVSAESRELAARARSGHLTLDELSGGTFTISNLGMFGVDHFTAVINPPQAAILAVGAARQEPVVRDGEVVAGTTMKATLSVDHRALDGATGARFLADLRDLVEHPLRIIV